MKKNYKITFLFKNMANLRPQAVQEIVLPLTYGNHIQEAFVELYNRYGDDVNSIMSIEEQK